MTGTTNTRAAVVNRPINNGRSPMKSRAIVKEYPRPWNLSTQHSSLAKPFFKETRTWVWDLAGHCLEVIGINRRGPTDRGRAAVAAVVSSFWQESYWSWAAAWGCWVN